MFRDVVRLQQRRSKESLEHQVDIILILLNVSQVCEVNAEVVENLKI